MSNDKFSALDEIAASKQEAPKIIDGLIKIPREKLPHQGKFYPESWVFAYSCPKAKDVANFSTLSDDDHIGMISCCEELVRKHVIIYDTEIERNISSGQINDSDRYFFILKLREYFLPGSPLTFQTKIETKDVTVELKAEYLQYKEQNKKLIDAFDGRSFTFHFDDSEQPITFLIPTIETTSKFFKYLIRAHKDKNDESKFTKNIYDKQFVLFAPYLYETGKESVKEISEKFDALREDETRFKNYNEIVNRLNLSNTNKIVSEISIDGELSVEETEIKFPKWKTLFIAQRDNSGYFD